ncbi:MAG: hypothetical protein KIS94_04850 [Chitinophagales bacterium]|nr:hypothetical protein [Chitinophagales bacterium]
MKKTTLILLGVYTCLAASSLNRYEFLIGVQTGAAGMFYGYQGYNPKFTTKAQSVAIPAGAEVLFGVKGFRLGYKFDYKHAFVKEFVTDYVDDTKGTDVTQQVDFRRNVFTHFFLMEYAAKVRTKKVPFAITPCLGVGSFNGFTFNRDTGVKTKYKDQWKSRWALTAGLNFEITKRRFSFLIGPNYTLNAFESKLNNTDRGFIHSVSLNLDFRLNLLRPRW